MTKFRHWREGVQSADKKPQVYRDPDDGKTKTRMVPVDKDIVKTNEVKRPGAPKITGDSIAIQRAKDAEHNKAMGRTKTGRKAPVRTMTSTQKAMALMRKKGM
jgi:hypothetical protein|tara:strand:+ start:996 stop:1304 length:309 start_codon:yes stop_codon:yes gene_type:complete